MINKIRSFLLIVFCLVLGGSLFLPAYAESEKTGGFASDLLCISYRGDTAKYAGNSKEAVLSAFSKGVDFVSVNIRKTDNDVFVLCGENEVEIKGIPLSEMLDLIGEDDVLILDFEFSLKDEIYDLLKGKNALSKACLRIKKSATDIDNWISSKEDTPMVIGVCSSFNVFTIRSFVKKLSYLPAVQLQSKNHFNVMYDVFCNKIYNSDDGTVAVAPMYNPDLCGQRSDSEDGWNDLVKRNFSIIETNNLEAFVDYKNNAYELKKDIGALLEKAEKIDADEYSLVSRENLIEGIENARALLDKGVASCDELQNAQSKLMLAVNNLTLKQGEDTQKGALNITSGKVVAAVLVGSAILAAQIYTYKMQKKKK